ncbi:MAG TPA: DUF721 domain-containing protein [Blastocatellia bacterium]|nr:DUF721 domain-containing protein [Blastocatellia bacterium]
MLTQLTSIIPKLLMRTEDSEQAREQSVFASWLVAVGGHIRRVTTPVRLERKTLIVAVTDRTWRKQLKAVSGELLFKLNSLLGAPLVTSIEFAVNPKLVIPVPEPPPQIEFVAPEQQAEPLKEVAGSIGDPELRGAFLRVAGKCLERRAR